MRIVLKQDFRINKTIFGKMVVCLTLSVILGGCAASKRMLTNWEDRRATLSRGLADIVDATDRALGDPRIEDEEEIVQVKVDLVPSYYSESEFNLNMPVRVRVPLPAIQRKTKFFFQIDSSADPRDKILEAASDLEDNKTLTSGFLFSPSEKIRSGAKLEVYWKENNPQTGVRPFLRYEVKPYPFRYYFEQQVYWRTDDRFGFKSTFQVDRILCSRSFLRFAFSGEYQEVTYAAHFGQGISYRKELGKNSVLSMEIGSRFNPHHGTTDRSTNELPEERDAHDSDKTYFRSQFVGKFPIFWLEYGIEPGVDYYWYHEEPWDYGASFTLRIIIFEAFLHDRQTASR